MFEVPIRYHPPIYPVQIRNITSDLENELSTVDILSSFLITGGLSHFNVQVILNGGSKRLENSTLKIQSINDIPLHSDFDMSTRLDIEGKGEISPFFLILSPEVFTFYNHITAECQLTFDNEQVVIQSLPIIRNNDWIEIAFELSSYINNFELFK